MQIDVVSFVGPPHMFSVTLAWPGAPDQTQLWSICAECHVDLIKLIASKGSPQLG